MTVVTDLSDPKSLISPGRLVTCLGYNLTDTQWTGQNSVCVCGRVQNTDIYRQKRLSSR